MAEHPREIAALIRFPAGANPEKLIEDYMVSPGCEAHTAEFDTAQIERAEILTLVPGPGSVLD